LENVNMTAATELNATGLAVVTSMFHELEMHGSRAAKELRRRHCEKYGTKHVDWAARRWMSERQIEFRSVPLWVELKNWASEQYPIHGHCGRTRRPRNRGRREGT
jgi:hypothetical protein